MSYIHISISVESIFRQTKLNSAMSNRNNLIYLLFQTPNCIRLNRIKIILSYHSQDSGAQQSSWLHLGLVPSAQGGVALSPSKVGVEPSQQIRCSLGHLPPGRPPGLPPVGVLPSAQRLGLPPSGQGGVLLPSYTYL